MTNNQSEFLKNLASMSPEQQEYALRGIPFHLATLAQWEDLEIVLSNLDFIQEKVVRGMANDVVNDYQFSTRQLADANGYEHIRFVIQEFARAFNQEFNHIQQYPEIASQQIFNNLYSYHGIDGAIGLHLRQFVDQKSYPYAAMWFRQLNTTPKTSVPRELLRTLSGHSAAVRTVCISPNGDHIASGGLDGKICIWKWQDGSLVASFDAHQEGVIAIAWYSDTPEETRIASAGADQFIRVWDWSSGTKLQEWNTKVESINSMIVIPATAQACVCGDDGLIRVFDLETGQEQSQLQGHVGRVLCLSHRPAGHTVVSGGEDFTVRLWHLGSMVKSERLYGPMDAVRATAIAPDATWVVAGGDDTTLRIWELQTTKSPMALRGHSQSIRCIALASDFAGDLLIISGSDDGTIKIWNRQTGKLVRTLKANKSGVSALAFDPSNHYFVSAGEDGTVIIWNASFEFMQDSWVEHDSSIVRLAAAQTKVVSGSSDRTVRIWNGEDGTHCFGLRGHFEAINDATIVGNKIISCSEDGFLRVYELETGKFLGDLNQRLAHRIKGPPGRYKSNLIPNRSEHGHTGSINCLHPISNRAFLSGGSDRTVRLWDVETGQQLLKFQGARGGIDKLIFSKKHLVVAGAGVGREISLWSTDGEINITYLTGHSTSITALCLTQDEQLISSSRDGTVRLWDISAREEIRRFSGHEHWVLCAATWSDYVASGGDDMTVRVWHIPSGKLVYILQGHTASISTIMVDPGAGRLFTCGEDQRLNVWSMNSGNLEASAYLSSVVDHLVLVHRQRICAGTQDGGVVFFSLEMNS